VEQSPAATPTVTWWKRENLVPGLALVVLAAAAWVYTLVQTGTMRGMQPPANADPMGAMEPASTLVHGGDLALFLCGWAVMMVAMMLPAALPLILLYRIIARKRLPPGKVPVGLGALLGGYVGVWTVAGLPVYAYNRLAATTGASMAIVPGLLLMGGGIYQFTALKHGCHTRCSNPLFFLMNKWRSGIRGALRLGVLHGLDCLGCCVGLMLALVALGMMQVAWMLTAAVIIFVEKTLPGGHRVARPLGLVLVAGGVVVLGTSLLQSMPAM
jgi:predicted metal-binding membrane protein